MRGTLENLSFRSCSDRRGPSGPLRPGGRVAEFLTVRDVLDETSLCLTALTGDCGLDRRVRTAHHSDLSNPVPWMISDTLLITHGAPLAESVDSGLSYLDRIRERSAGLIIATGASLETVGAAFVEHACSVKLPLLVMPPSVPIRDVIIDVFHACAADEQHNLRRLVAVQRQMVDLLVGEEGIPVVLSRLSSSLEIGLVLFDPEGHVVIAAGQEAIGHEEDLWRMYRESGCQWGPRDVLQVEHEAVQIRRVTKHGVLKRILAAIGPSMGEELTDMTLAFAQRMIALDLVYESQAEALAHRAQSILLGQFLAAEGEVPGHVDLLLAQGIDVGKPWRVLAFGEGHRGSQNLAQISTKSMHFIAGLADEIVGRFTELGIPALATTHDGLVVTLIELAEVNREEQESIVKEVLQAAAENHPTGRLYGGASSMRVGSVSPAAAQRQAVVALERALACSGGDQLVFFDDTNASFHLLEGQSTEALMRMAESGLSKLMDYDREHDTALLMTLKVYLENHMSVHATCCDLYLHRNSLRKRLRRIEQILSVNMENMHDIMTLYIALTAAELLGEVGDLLPVRAAGEPSNPPALGGSPMNHTSS